MRLTIKVLLTIAGIYYITPAYSGYTVGGYVIRDIATIKGSGAKNDGGIQKSLNYNYNIRLDDSIKSKANLFGGFIGWDGLSHNNIYTNFTIDASIGKHDTIISKKLEKGQLVNAIEFGSPRFSMLNNLNVNLEFRIGKKISYFTPYFSIGSGWYKITLNDQTGNYQSATPATPATQGQAAQAGTAEQPNIYHHDAYAVNMGLGMQVDLTKRIFVDLNFRACEVFSNMEHTFLGHVYIQDINPQSSTQATSATTQSSSITAILSGQRVAPPVRTPIGKQSINISYNKFSVRFGIRLD